VTTNHVLGLKLVLPDGSIVDVGTNSGNARISPVCLLAPRNAGHRHGNYLANSKQLNQFVFSSRFTSIEAAGAAVSDIISAYPSWRRWMATSINAVEDVVAGCYPRDAAAILLVK